MTGFLLRSGSRTTHKARLGGKSNQPSIFRIGEDVATMTEIVERTGREEADIRTLITKARDRNRALSWSMFESD